MARYGQTFKDRAVARLLPPESAAVELIAREVGVSAGTLQRWRDVFKGIASNAEAKLFITDSVYLSPLRCRLNSSR